MEVSQARKLQFSFVVQFVLLNEVLATQILVHAFDGGMYIRGLKGSPLGGLSYEPNFK